VQGISVPVTDDLLAVVRLQLDPVTFERLDRAAAAIESRLPSGTRSLRAASIGRTSTTAASPLARGGVRCSTFVDRTSFAVMQRLGVLRAASLDEHFAVFRFGRDRRRAFEIVR
jgi:predicted nucleic acid-binding protein